MPMKTHRRRSTRETCYLGLCHKPVDPHHHFDIDLRDGKPLIRIRACSKEHLDWLRIGHKSREVTHGG